MNSGDWLLIDMHDAPQRFQVVIHDLTTGENGSMTASAANGFGQVKFAPTGTDCVNIPYDFHPMYSTSSEHTRVPWTAHSYNIAFSDEVGHFEYCNSVDPNGNCFQSNNPNDPGSPDPDDATFCFPASDSLRIQIGGCTGSDVDFDGVPYQLVWPGTLNNPSQDKQLHPGSVLFTSPLFVPDAHPSQLSNYSPVAFETDLPRVEFATAPPRNRSTGVGCVNPPGGANFYPFYTTRMSEDGNNNCLWQLGGANIPGTTQTFGGSSTAEYGGLLNSLSPGPGNMPIFRFNNFRNVLNGNPCSAVNDNNNDQGQNNNNQ
jgi:hypothetical protein